MTIPFFDLAAVNARLMSEFSAAFTDTIKEDLLVLGRALERFEADFAAYCGVREAVGVASGLDALIISLRALSMEPGDEVIVPAFTFVATVFAIRMAGATPVLVDVCPKTGLVRAEDVARAVGPRTRAIVPVHLYGRLCEMDGLMEIARAHKLRVVEDAAQAHGAMRGGRLAGSFGDLGCFSFYPTKNLGALGDGGAVIGNDAELIERLRVLRNYGSREKHRAELVSGNSRLDTIQAKMLLIKLAHLQADNTRRRKVARRYISDIRSPAVTLPETPEDPLSHVWHIFPVRVADPIAFSAHMNAEGVETARHYPIACHRQPALASDFAGLEFAEAVAWAREEMSLPISPVLEDEAVDRVIAAVNRWAG